MVKEISLSCGLIAYVDGEDYDRILAHNWWPFVDTGSGNTYVIRNGPRPERKRIWMHHEIMGTRPGQVLWDHVNGNGLDNRRGNLRRATHQQNTFNSRKHGHQTSSQYKGVCWYTRQKNWHAQIGVNGRKIHIGYYANEIEAAKAYDKTALEHFGEYARLNFPNQIAVTFEE